MASPTPPIYAAWKHLGIHLAVTTRWASARDPQAENAAFNITLSEGELQMLIAALQSGLTDNV